MELHFEYYVVEFLHQPYENIETYVCVPYSWIQANAYGPKDRRIAVAYPAEFEFTTKKYVEQKKSPRRGWKHYCAVLKFGTDKFREAQKYIRKKNNSQKQQPKKKKNGFSPSLRIVSSENVCKEKGLKVRIQRISTERISTIEQRVKTSIKKISRNIFDKKRPTVIKSTKSLNEINDSNKILDNLSKNALTLEFIDPKKNAQIDHQTSFLQNDSFHDPVKKAVIQLNNEHLQQGQCLRQSQTVTAPRDEIKGVQKTVSSETDSRYKADVYSNLVFSQSIEQSTNSCRPNSDLSEQLAMNGHPKPKVYQNIPYQKEIITEDPCRQNLPKFTQNNAHDFNNLHKQSFFIEKDTQLSKYPHQDNIFYKSIANLEDTQMKQCTELGANDHKYSNITVTGIHAHINLDTCKMNNRKSTESYSRESVSNALIMPSSVPNVTNLPCQSSQIQISLNENQYSSNHEKNTLQNISPLKIINKVNCVNHKDHIISSSSNKMINLNDVRKNIMKNMIIKDTNLPTATECLTHISDPIQTTQFPQECGYYTLQSFHSKKKSIEERNKEKYMGRKLCPQSTVPKYLKDIVMGDSQNIFVNYPATTPDPTKYTNPSTEFHSSVHSSVNMFPYYNTFQLPPRTEMSSEHDPSLNSKHFMKNPHIWADNDCVVANDKNIDFTGQQEKSSYINTINNQPQAKYSSSMRSNQPNNDPFEKYLKDLQDYLRSDRLDQKSCLPSKPKVVLNNSKDYVVEDPRKVIIKKVIKIKPMEQSTKSIPTENKHTNKIDEKRSQISFSAHLENGSSRNLRIQDIITAEINKMSTLDNENNSNSLTSIVPNITANDNVLDKISEEIKSKGSSSNITNNTSVAANSLPITENQSSLTVNQNALIFENSTLRNLLLHEINYVREINVKTNKIIPKCDEDMLKNSENLNILTSNQTNSIEKNLKQSEDIHFNDSECNDRKINNCDVNMFKNYENFGILTCNQNNNTEKHVKQTENKQLNTKNCDVNILEKYENLSILTPNETNNTEKNMTRSEDKQINITKYNDTKSNDFTKTVTLSDQNIRETHKAEINTNKGYHTNDDLENIQVNDEPGFNLPLEYRPSNSKWTLKYQRVSPGIVELIPGSRVYVNENILRQCLRFARNYNILARRLLLEIFSFNALRVCSLTGVKRVIGDHRPGLDGDALSTMLAYVEQRGRAVGWGPMDKSAVLYSLRNKIHEVRASAGILYKRRLKIKQSM